MKSILIIINPIAGKEIAKKKLYKIISSFQKKNCKTLIYIIKNKDSDKDIEKLINDIDCVICCGGDGTISHITRIVSEANREIPIAYIPCGTTNDFSRNLGLTKNFNKNIYKVLHGKVHKHDLSFIDDKSFVYVAAFGAFVEASFNTPQSSKNILGRLSYIISGAKELLNIKEFNTRITIDDKIVEGKFALGIVTNSKYVGGFHVPKKYINQNNGKMTIYLYKKPKPINMFNKLAYLFSDTYNDKDVIIYEGRDIKIEFDEDIIMTVDGEEYNPGRKVKISVKKDGIRYIY